MRPPNKNIPHRDGEWIFDGRNFKRRRPRSYLPPPEPVPPPLRRVPTWISTLILGMILGCIVVPPLVTLLVKGRF